MTIRLDDSVDGVANPDWVLHAARRGGSVGSGRNVKAGEPNHASFRRAVLDQVLAVKILDAHLRNRIQLMQSDPTDLSGVSPTEAALLIRGMAAAGHADGELQQAERARLVIYARTAPLTEDARCDILAEIERPPSIESLVRQVETPRIAERFYAVSIAVIGRESAVSRAYLAYLAIRLDLSNDIILRLNRENDSRR